MLDQMASTRASLPQVAFLAAILSLVIFYLTKSSCSSHEWSEQSLGGPLTAQRGKSHVLVTGGAGFIGSHASLRLLKEGHAVTVLDNLSRGNLGAIRILKRSAKPSRFQFLEVDLGHSDLVLEVFRRSNIDLVIHFAALAYVGAFPSLCCMRSLFFYRTHLVPRLVNLSKNGRRRRRSPVRHLGISRHARTYFVLFSASTYLILIFFFLAIEPVLKALLKL